MHPKPSSPISAPPALCHALMDRSPLPIAELEGEDHAVRYANPAFCRLTGKSQETLTGRPFAETIQDSACLGALDRVYRTGEAVTHTESERPGAHPVYWSYAIWQVSNTDGHTVGVMMQVTETTKFHRDARAMSEALLISSVRQHENTEAAEKSNDLLRTEIGHRRREEEQLRRAFEAVMTNMNEGLYSTDRQGLVTSMNPGAEALFGWRFEELRGRNMRDIIHYRHPDGTPRAAEEFAEFQVLETGKAVTDHEDVFIRKDGSLFPVVYSAAPLREGKDTVGLVVVFRDVTERKRAEEHERVLMNELAHRNRNLLAVTQAIVSSSLTNERCVAENRKILMQRLEALARGQKILHSGSFEGAQLAEIIRLELNVFSGRYQAGGPDVTLNAKAAQTFALLIHELATNAIKHGALSDPHGRVVIDWSVDGRVVGARFKFRWQEHDGPLVVHPSRTGFGRVLIEKVAVYDLSAQPRIDFAPEGLSYEIEAPLQSVATPS